MEWRKITADVYDETLTYLQTLVKVDDKNPTNHDFMVRRSSDGEVLGTFHFQQGALDEQGPNGILNEDLLMMLIDRVESFQRSKLKCRENENALQHLYEALFWLNQRNSKRKA